MQVPKKRLYIVAQSCGDIARIVGVFSDRDNAVRDAGRVRTQDYLDEEFELALQEDSSLSRQQWDAAVDRDGGPDRQDTDDQLPQPRVLTFPLSGGWKAGCPVYVWVEGPEVRFASNSKELMACLVQNHLDQVKTFFADSDVREFTLGAKVRLAAPFKSWRLANFVKA